MGVVTTARNHLTNFHVVRQRGRREVVFNDAMAGVGKGSGGNPERDLAVIRVRRDDLDQIEIGALTAQLVTMSSRWVSNGIGLRSYGDQGIVPALDRISKR